MHQDVARASAQQMPQSRIGSLSNAKQLTCSNTNFESANGNKLSFWQSRMTRTLGKRMLDGKLVDAFIYRLDRPGGQGKKSNERINYVMQKPDGTIVSLAHHDGSDGRQGSYAVGEQSIQFPGELTLGQVWLGDSPLVPDSDVTKSTVSGVLLVDGQPNWIITSTLVKGNDSLKQLKMVYVLNPSDLRIDWLKASGSGHRDGQSFIFSFDSECRP